MQEHFVISFSICIDQLLRRTLHRLVFLLGFFLPPRPEASKEHKGCMLLNSFSPCSAVIFFVPLCFKFSKLGSITKS